MGGRYDEVGKAFGRARPATGFSLDLRGVVTALAPAQPLAAVYAPAVEDAALTAKIAALRAAGHVVVQELAGYDAYRSELNYNKQLVKSASGWDLADL
jgi:ATP phosphoribosyltransferase regulatory subunit